MTEEWQIEFYIESDGTAPVQEFIKDPSLTPGETEAITTSPKIAEELWIKIIKRKI